MSGEVKVLCSILPGSSIRWVAPIGALIVCHPEHAPMLVHMDGKIEYLKPGEGK